jgi:hypothetical protein
VSFLPLTVSNINGFNDIPYPYSALPDVSLKNVAFGSQNRAITNGMLSGVTNVFVTWKYPDIQDLFPLAVEDNIQAVAVGFQVQVFEGVLGGSDIQDPNAPLPIAYEEIQNLRSTEIWNYVQLTKGAGGRTDIPSVALVTGLAYSCRIRALLFINQDTDGGGHFRYTEWGASSSVVINQPPQAVSLAVNGESNPTRVASSDTIMFSFTSNDPDGPEYLYRIQVGTVAGGGFAANIWDSGIIHGGQGKGPRDFLMPYAGSPLTPGTTYAWRVGVQDGISDGGFTSANDTFKINAAPTVSSLRADGNELIYGDVPDVKDENVQIAWTFQDADGDSQNGYSITIMDEDGQEILSSGEIVSSAASVTVPTFPQNKRISISIKVKDGTEFGDVVTGAFKTNARPRVTNFKIDNQINPGNVASGTPTFTWLYFDETPGDVQVKYRLQVAIDEQFSSLVWDTGEITSALSTVVYGSTASPVVAPQALLHAVLYYVRVEASDGISFSEWTQGFFAVNQAPSDPVLMSPAAGAYAGSITATWTASTDPDGDAITYRLEISDRRSSNRNWQPLAGPFPSTTTSASIDLSNIKAGDNYGIRVIASDNFAESNPSNGGTSPRFSILNHAPNTPAFLAPKAGDVIAKSMTVEILEADPVDVDGDQVFYVLELTRDASAASPIWEKVGVFPAGRSTIVINVADMPDGASYQLRITSRDAKGAIGTVVGSEIFAVFNQAAATDFERFEGNLFVGSTDGRLFKAREAIWQVDEDWDDQRARVPFQVFSNGSPKVVIEGGALKITTVSGSTYILRQAADTANITDKGS